MSKEERIKQELTDLLNELLSYGNQENSFTVTGINLATGKFSVDFDIVEVEEDNYVSFAGY